MQVKVLVNGAAGKMGQETVKAINADPELKLVGERDKDTDLWATLKVSKPDVVVDFTTPGVVYENAVTIIDLGIRPVIGTTGLTAQQIADLQQRCVEKKLGGLIAPNFSLGAVLMMQFASMAVRYLPDVEIMEFHHPAKLDAPSGTALRTAELIAAAREQAPQKSASQESVQGARGADYQTIPIHAIRLPGLVASQEVLFGGQGETLSIRHDTIHREAFMPGVRLACKKVMELDYLALGLDKLLFDLTCYSPRLVTEFPYEESLKT